MLKITVVLTSVLNRKNGFAHRAKLAQKLRCRKGTKSSFCAKVFIGFENLVMAQTFLIQKYISFFSETFSILI